MKKPKFTKIKEQACFENCCDCLYYGYGFKYVNTCGLSEERAREIWEIAIEYVGGDF